MAQHSNVIRQALHVRCLLQLCEYLKDTATSSNHSYNELCQKIGALYRQSFNEHYWCLFNTDRLQLKLFMNIINMSQM